MCSAACKSNEKAVKKPRIKRICRLSSLQNPSVLVLRQEKYRYVCILCIHVCNFIKNAHVTVYTCDLLAIGGTTGVFNLS